MKIKIIMLLLIVSNHFAIAQDFALKEQVKKIEHLLEYNQYDVAEKKADSLISIIDNKDKFLEQKLQLLLLKGRMYDIEEQNNKALEVLLDVVDKAESNKFYKVACHTNIILALIYEKMETPKLSKQYLDAADRIRKEHNLEEFYSTILVRRSLYQRWFTKNLDSAMYYTKKALRYAKKHNNEYDITEATHMIGIYEFKKDNNTNAVKRFSSAVKYYLKTNNFNDAATMYFNIAYVYEKMNVLHEAKRYNDSAYITSIKSPAKIQSIILEQKAGILYAMKHLDSAYFYLKKSREARDKEVKDNEAATIKQITEQYENDKKEATIQSKNVQMWFVVGLLAVIILASILLIRKNRQVGFQNRIINTQLGELTKTLGQKQVLLSELQHRVKNNLQHVISILEIQKESVTFNNIDELIRGNQNRIHSMALLHKKLNISDNVNEVELSHYITDLSELVKESYDNPKKKISLNIICDIEKTSIEKALPLGLIIVELVSNSMKYAYKKRNIGVITIEITHENDMSKLYYADNGNGFDFNTTHSKGLGLEIIKGLIDQLGATYKTNSVNGFELQVFFKFTKI